MNTTADDPYEDLSVDAPFTIHLSAGALAGIAEHTVTFPLDSIKTRLQVHNHSCSLHSPSISNSLYKDMNHAWKSIRNNRHSSQLWRGVGSVVLGAGPSHAVYFATYEYTKRILANYVSGDALIGSYSLAGACATTMADAVMTPFDVVKQRMQVSSGSTTSTLVTTAKNIIKTEGVGAFYVSYPTTLLLNIPFHCVQFPTYEVIKSLLNPTNSYSPTTHILAGGAAGALAAALTTPIDVIKTALQTRGLLAEEERDMVKGMKSAIKWVYRKQGWRGFGRGISPRVLTYMPSTAICWTMYEYFKWVLGQ